MKILVRIALFALIAAAISAPTIARADDDDPAESLHSYLSDSKQSTTPADIFLPGSTEPVRADDSNNNNTSNNDDNN